jgi:hypothetical protein
VCGRGCGECGARGGARGAGRGISVVAALWYVCAMLDFEIWGYRLIMVVDISRLSRAEYELLCGVELHQKFGVPRL